MRVDGSVPYRPIVPKNTPDPEPQNDRNPEQPAHREQPDRTTETSPSPAPDKVAPKPLIPSVRVSNAPLPGATLDAQMLQKRVLEQQNWKPGAHSEAWARLAKERAEANDGETNEHVA